MIPVSLQFTDDGQMVLDDNGNPIYDRPPTGDLLLAMGVSLGTFHADPDLGSEVPALVKGEPRRPAEIRNAIAVGLQRLESVGVVTVDDVIVFERDSIAQVYTTQIDQPFKVKL